jgi:hypothetical protein
MSLTVSRCFGGQRRLRLWPRRKPSKIGSHLLHVSSRRSQHGRERVTLEITDVEKPEGPITVRVFVKPANAAAQDPGINVGSFAAVRVGGQMVWPSQTLSFDITGIANRYAGQMITVELISYRIHAQGAESYPPLKYGQMRIVNETP